MRKWKKEWLQEKVKEEETEGMKWGNGIKIWRKNDRWKNENGGAKGKNEGLSDKRSRKKRVKSERRREK